MTVSRDGAGGFCSLHGKSGVQRGIENWRFAFFFFVLYVMPPVLVKLFLQEDTPLVIYRHQGMSNRSRTGFVNKEKIKGDIHHIHK